LWLQDYELNTDTLQIWHGNSDDDANYLSYWGVLDVDEQTRAEKFSNDLLRKRYVVAHGRLRTVLAQLLNEAPEKIKIAIAEQGKPYLADSPELAFNLSHSANVMVIAIGWHCQIGVDLETCRPRAGLQGLVEKCFAKEEITHWNCLPKAQQTIEFYRFWTRKEALVKATGRGIVLGLNQCVVNPENQHEFLRVPAVCGAASKWQVMDIALGQEKCCALVTDKGMGDVEFNRF
jgi:4'-phosphopantetheinyl transferase